jgi:hypothetical protein
VRLYALLCVSPPQGVAIAPDAGGAINVSFVYRDQTSGAYAIISAISKSPLQPGVFGLEVNSNTHDDQIIIRAGLFGDGPTTQVDYFLLISPPAV